MSDRLSLWGVARDARLARIDFTTVPARSSNDTTLRVKNESSSYRARDVTVAFTAGPNDPYEFFLSLDGETFTASVTLGDLAPTAFSRSITLRRVTPSTTAPGSYRCNLRASATSWTL